MHKFLKVDGSQTQTGMTWRIYESIESQERSLKNNAFKSKEYCEMQYLADSVLT